MVCLKCRNLKYLTNKYWAWNTHSEKSVMLTSFCDDDILWPEELESVGQNQAWEIVSLSSWGTTAWKSGTSYLSAGTLVRLEPTGQLGK